LARGKRDVDGGRTVVETVDDGGKAGHRTALVLGNSVDRAIILRRRNLEAAIDRALGPVELALGGIQILQRDLRAGVGVDAERHGYSPFQIWWRTRVLQTLGKARTRFCNARATRLTGQVTDIVRISFLIVINH